MLVRALVAGLVVVVTGTALTQSQSRNPPPPLPWLVENACPEQDCHFGPWAACEALPVRAERRGDSPIAFTLEPGERFTAVTGVVEVLHPGMLVLRDTMTYIPPDWSLARDTIRASPRDTFYLLNSFGDGYLVWWLHARADTGREHWWESPEPRTPPRAKVVRPQRQLWWVRVRNRQGKEGWVVPTYRTMSGFSARAGNGVARCARGSEGE
jgi:hypothetical protein